MVSFRCSDPLLEAGFAWARERALSYAHNGGDPVGLWYEAALPGRDAFCIRDAAHQRAGAALLGLTEHTYNMFRRFAESCADSRDDCMYWEIAKTGGPAPVDYASDEDFWYNLPANFDLLQACWAEYCWTGDGRYLEHPFLRFYESTCTRFMARWDRDGDGWPEHRKTDGRRGLGSYNESRRSPALGGDLPGAMFAGLQAYANILARRGETARARETAARAADVRRRYLAQWYFPQRRRFYGALEEDGRFRAQYYDEGNFLPIYFGLLDGAPELPEALDNVLAHGMKNTEGKTYLPQLCFGRGREAEGLRALRALCSPKLPRREYPEVSFAALSSLAQLAAGVTAPEPGVLRTLSGLPEGWAELRDVPVLGGRIHVRQEGAVRTALDLPDGPSFRWRVCFPGTWRSILIDGEPCPARQERDPAGRAVSCLDVPLLRPGRHSAAAE
ncbi:MAG: hypothetical protein LBJ11_00685 [Oscillospiraceae bacterium]|jgi:hypothetical protein|nr:hypothetical protein [Oscillospiraceae bacterium]